MASHNFVQQLGLEIIEVELPKSIIPKTTRHITHPGTQQQQSHLNSLV